MDTIKNTEKKTNYEKLPNKAFDSEYMTEWVREVKFLASKGIRYTFVKRTPDYNIKQYKYKKTPELFAALTEFYSQSRREKEFNAYSKVVEECTNVDFPTMKTCTIITDGDGDV